MENITRRQFSLGRMICDAIQGTLDITRPVEDVTLRTEPVYKVPCASHLIHRVDPQEIFWQDVRSVKSMLDEKGHYQGLTKPVEIADYIVSCGTTWVKAKMVKQAQKQIKNSTNCRK